jgi:hypothetical protein
VEAAHRPQMRCKRGPRAEETGIAQYSRACPFGFDQWRMGRVIGGFGGSISGFPWGYQTPRLGTKVGATICHPCRNLAITAAVGLTYQQNQFSYESRIEIKRKRPNLLHRNRLQAKLEVKRKLAGAGLLVGGIRSKTGLSLLLG